jgi:hypothetical protein
VINAVHLCRILRGYADYYNRWRTHLSLAKDVPFSRGMHRSGTMVRIAQLGGLHHAFA